jgi:hypothetical protein
MKLVRMLILAAGLILLIRPTPAFQLGACYSQMNTTPDTACSACCKNGDTPITVTTDGSGTGNLDFGYSSVDCGGEASPGSCYPSDGNSACPSNASYQTTITNPSCGGASGSSCHQDSDCEWPFICGSDGTCRTCAGGGQFCTFDLDCCSGSCYLGQCTWPQY